LTSEADEELPRLLQKKAIAASRHTVYGGLWGRQLAFLYDETTLNVIKIYLYNYVELGFSMPRSKVSGALSIPFDWSVRPSVSSGHF